MAAALVPAAEPRRPMAAPPLLHLLETVLYSTDLDSCRDFYVRVVGLPPLSDARPRGMSFRVPGPPGAPGVRSVLLVFDPRETVKPNPNVPSSGAFGPGHVCFRIDPARYDEWKAHLTSAGFPIEREVNWPSGVRSLYVRDPSHNSVEFMAGDDWARYEV